MPKTRNIDLALDVVPQPRRRVKGEWTALRLATAYATGRILIR